MRSQTIYQERLTAVREKLSDWEVDAILISGASNRRWLSGFTGSAGQLLITSQEAWLVTDFRYWEQAAMQSPAFTLFKHKREEGHDTKALFAALKDKRIGIEAGIVTLGELERLKKDAERDDLEWVLLKSTIEPLRQIKTVEEIAAIQDAATITDRAMAQVQHLARPGMTERALAWELEKRMREWGADKVAFDVIVASGPNSALPHHSPGDRLLHEGDALIVDMGAALNGYNSDLTRTFYLGANPSEKFWEIYNVVLEAQTAVLHQAHGGMSSQAIDALARDVITAAGYKEQFGHGLGHGVGLDIHEDPVLSPHFDEVIVPSGTALTVEPGIYLPGWGGVRMSSPITIRAP